MAQIKKRTMEFISFINFCSNKQTENANIIRTIDQEKKVPKIEAIERLRDSKPKLERENKIFKDLLEFYRVDIDKYNIERETIAVMNAMTENNKADGALDLDDKSNYKYSRESKLKMTKELNELSLKEEFYNIYEIEGERLDYEIMEGFVTGKLPKAAAKTK
jgi:hypothetical protein